MKPAPIRRDSLMDPHIFNPRGEYALPEAAIISAGTSLWAEGHVSLLPLVRRMPEMAATVTVHDSDGAYLAGIKPNGDEYCSCIPDRRDPRRCPHLWAMIVAVQAQRRPKPANPSSRTNLSSRPSSPQPDVFRPSSPQFGVFRHMPLRPLSQLSPIRQMLPRRHAPDTLGLGVVELLARSESFVRAFRTAFEKVFIDTLTASLLAQLFHVVQRGFWVDYANVHFALKSDRLLDRPDRLAPEPTELLQRIIRHCDKSAGGSALHSLLQWEAEAFVRCTQCALLTFGAATYSRWRASVYPAALSPKSDDDVDPDTAPALDKLLDLSLLDTTHAPCARCRTRTLHVVKHTPLVFGRLLLVRVVSDAEPGALFVPLQFTDSALGHRWHLVGMLCAHRGGYATIIAEGGQLVELVGGMPQPHPVRGLPAPPVLVLYEREDEGPGYTSGDEE